MVSACMIRPHLTGTNLYLWYIWPNLANSFVSHANMNIDDAIRKSLKLNRQM